MLKGPKGLLQCDRSCCHFLSDSFQFISDGFSKYFDTVANSNFVLQNTVAALCFPTEFALQLYCLSCFEWKSVCLRHYKCQWEKREQEKKNKCSDILFVADITSDLSFINSSLYIESNTDSWWGKRKHMHMFGQSVPPKLEVIPETRISVLSCIQAQSLSPQGDYFRGHKV